MTEKVLLNLVSVIVPAYNYAHFLPDTLQSIQEQSYPHWECIVVDDGSTDNTRNIVAEFVKADERFKYIFQKNKGLPGARNTGIKEACGKYIQFLDADDMIEANKLADHVSFLIKHPDVDIVYAEARYFSDEHPDKLFYDINCENIPWMPKVSGKGKTILTELLKKNFMPVNSPMVRREVFDNLGLFDETLKSHEDWELWLRCANQGKSFVFLDRPKTFALVRCHSQSMTRAWEIMTNTTLTIRKKMQSVIDVPELRRLNRIHLNYAGFDLALHNLRTGNRIGGIALLIKHGWQDIPIQELFVAVKLLLVPRKQKKLA